jgi:serpin B
MTRVNRFTMAYALVAALAVVLIAGTTCSAPSTEDASGKPEGGATTVVATPEDAKVLAEATNEFAIDLYLRIKGGGNLFFSPYSVATALTMTWTGARETTAEEMASVLHLPVSGATMHTRLARDAVAAASGSLERSLTASPDVAGYELRVANSLWGQDGYDFLDEFTSRLRTCYGAGLRRVDFAGDVLGARLAINEWAEKQTSGRIQGLIPEGGIDTATALVLANAVYFKGTWESRFREDSTRRAVFHGAMGDTDVDMMSQRSSFGYFENDDLSMLAMPYTGERLSMLVVLPREGLLGGLDRVEGGLTSELLDSWVVGMREQEVSVELPKFEITWGTTDLATDLIALGMNDAFRNADFSGMTGNRDLFISGVFHKAFVAVDEAGSEAAAATAVVMKRTAMPSGPEFRADRPFMFLIRDDVTGAILFMGRVVTLGM